MKKHILFFIAIASAISPLNAEESTAEERIFFKKEYNTLFQEWMYVAEKQKLNKLAGRIEGSKDSLQVRKSDFRNP